MSLSHGLAVWSDLGQAWAPAAAMLLAKTTVLVAVALVLDRLLEQRLSARARHLVFSISIALTLLLPLLIRVVPSWEVLPTLGRAATTGALGEVLAEPVPGLERIAQADVGTSMPAKVTTPSEVAADGAALSTIPADGWMRGAHSVWPALWMLGLAVALLTLIKTVMRERALVRHSQPLEGRWQRDLEILRRTVGLRRAVRLRSHLGTSTPVTGGILRPAVVVPRSAIDLPASGRRAVLAHELVHVLRLDVLRQLLARLLAAVYWFHPLVRLACRRAAMVREQACDEAVLDLGFRPSDYAGHLLTLAERTPNVCPAMGLAMAHPSQLERRLLVILDPQRPRRGGLLAGLALVLMLVLAGVLVAAQPASWVAAPAAPPAASSPPAALAPAPPAPSSPPAAPAATAPPTPVSPVLAVAVSAPPSPASAPPSPASAPVVAAAAMAAPAAVPDTACVDGLEGTYRGSMWQDDGHLTSMVGTFDGDQVVMQNVTPELRVCARLHGEVEVPAGGNIVMGREAWAHIETIGPAGRQRVFVELSASGDPVYQLFADGRSCVFDESAQKWLTAALAVVADLREIGMLRGERGSLRGEIGSIHGEQGSLRGEIGSIHGERGSRRGEIGSLRGELGSMHGEIGSLRGEIGSLRGRRHRADAGERTEIDAKIDRLEADIDDLERTLRDRKAEVEAEIAALEAELDDGDDDHRIAAIEAQIEALDVEGNVADLEQQIVDLDADGKIVAIERGLERKIKALERAASSLSC